MLLLRRDLARVAIVYGLIGSVVQVLTEIAYTRDYWAPPTVLNTRISIEDVFFGFGITTVPLLSYPVLRRCGYGPRERRGHLGTYLGFGGTTIVVLFIGTSVLGCNSIIASCVLLGSFTVIICALRPDLMRPALFAVSVTTAAALVCYVTLFDFIAPDWWSRYWKLGGGRLGVTILGNVPLTELMCYVTWAGFAVTQHPFIFGRAFRPRPAHLLPPSQVLLQFGVPELVDRSDLPQNLPVVCLHQLLHRPCRRHPTKSEARCPEAKSDGLGSNQHPAQTR
jgi:hypothetical protein